jgi:hypothetical protein
LLGHRGVFGTPDAYSEGRSFLVFAFGSFCLFAIAFLMPDFGQDFVKISLCFGYEGRPTL